MKISVVTPLLGDMQYFDETVMSIFSQAGDFEIEHIIQYGGDSADDLKYINDTVGRYRDINSHINVTVYAEPDRNMYDALNKGFSRCTGDIMAWLNADDMYMTNAFQTVTEIFKTYPDVSWISGERNHLNVSGSSVWSPKEKYRAFSRRYIEKGYYDYRYSKYGFHWIQQDTVFWRSSLWKDNDVNLDISYEFAADYYLWKAFSKYTDLVKVHSILSGFRLHDGQMTSIQKRYDGEVHHDGHPPIALAIANYLNELPRNHTLFHDIFITGKLLKSIYWIMGLKWGCMVGRSIYWNSSDRKWNMRNPEVI